MKSYTIGFKNVLTFFVLIASILVCDSFSNLHYNPLRTLLLRYGKAQSSSFHEIKKKFKLQASIPTIPTPVIEAEGSGSPCRIKVIGVGGGGGNAVNSMMESSTGVLEVELWAVDTDAQALSRNLAPNKLNIGNIIVTSK